MNLSRITILFVVAMGCMLSSIAFAAEKSSVADLISRLKTSDEAAQMEAADQLGDLGPKAAEAVAPLTALLKSNSADVRAHAAWALGEIGELNDAADAAVPALIDLAKDSDHSVRRQAVRAAMKTNAGPQAVVTQCIDLLNDADPGIRISILDAVAGQGKKAVPALISLLKNDKTAYWACLALRDIGPDAKAAVPGLIEKLSDPKPEVRREAILALAVMDAAGLPAVDAIAATLNKPDTQVAATYALGRLGKIPAAAEAKIRENAKSDDRLLATTSLWALTRVHPEDKQLRIEATTRLVEGLKSEEAFVRSACARALAALPPAPEITIPIWEKTFKGADDEAIFNALDAWAELGPAAVPSLTNALQHPKVRRHVAFLLGQIGPEAAPAAKALAALVEDQDEDDAHEAIIALANIGPGAKDAVPALVKAMEDLEDPNSHAMIYALGRIGPNAAAAKPILLQLVKSNDKQLALVSAWALANIEPSSAEVAKVTVPLLTGGLTSEMPLVRLGSAEALGNLGPAAKAALPDLQKAANDEEPAVRDAVSKALKQISSK